MRNDWEFPYGKAGRQSASNTFNFPSEADILAGGTLGDELSFFMEFAFEGGESSAMGWLQYQSVVGPPNAFNLKAGDVGKHELGLFTSRTENSLTVNDYLYSSWQIPYPDAAVTSFDNTDGFLVANAQPGLELNGLGSRWRYALGVVNGNDGSTQDNNSAKDVYLQTAWKFGGLGFDGSSGEKAEGSAPPVAGRDDSFIVSLFAYDGAALVTPTGGPDSTDRFWRLGLGGKWFVDKLAVGGGYVLGTNDDPYGTVSTSSVDSRSWFLETEYVATGSSLRSIRTLVLDLNNVADCSRRTRNGSWRASGARARQRQGSSSRVGTQNRVASSRPSPAPTATTPSSFARLRLPGRVASSLLRHESKQTRMVLPSGVAWTNASAVSPRGRGVRRAPQPAAGIRGAESGSGGAVGRRPDHGHACEVGGWPVVREGSEGDSAAGNVVMDQKDLISSHVLPVLRGPRSASCSDSQLHNVFSPTAEVQPRSWPRGGEALRLQEDGRLPALQRPPDVGCVVVSPTLRRPRRRGTTPSTRSPRRLRARDRGEKLKGQEVALKVEDAKACELRLEEVSR
jgi:hypothetical protein